MSNTAAKAQSCSTDNPPLNLQSTYLPGSGVLLQWDAIPGSVGVLVRAVLPSGSFISQRIVGTEPSQLFVPESLLSPGTYSWRVQASCNISAPFDLTPVSAIDQFTVAGSSTCPATVVDIDGNIYPVIQIGDQCWMQENLRAERYANGDHVAANLVDVDWSSTNSGAFSVYANDLANKAIYGLLYNWYAASDSRGICPDGWHVPSDGEWTTLTSELGGLSMAGGQMKSSGTLGTGTGLWQDPNLGATNSSGFTGLPAGARYLNGLFDDLGYMANWWSSTEFTLDGAWYRSLVHSQKKASKLNSSKRDGYPIRCLQD